MGLPTSIPSGGDGLDRFSKPVAPRAAQSAAPAQRSQSQDRPVQQRQPKGASKQKRETNPRSTPALQVTPEAPATSSSTTAAVDPEYAAFLSWKAEQEAKASAQETVAAPRSAKAPQPVQTDELPDEPVLDAPTDGDWVVDPKTGERYQQLPQASREAIRAYKGTKGAGFTLDEMKRFVGTQPDFDIDDLNGTAQIFMAHLRIPPSKEEQEAILRRKAELAEEQRAKRAEMDQELNAKEGILEDPDEDPFAENQKAKRGLFGRKR